MTEAILVGDVGGTNTRLGCAALTSSGWVIENYAKLPNDAYANFEETVQAYLQTCEQKPANTCFAIAGPVVDNTVTMTNRNWQISGIAIAKSCSLDRVILVNDFAAMARAVPELPKDALKHLIPGVKKPDAPIVVTGPGTGLGVATLLKSNTGAWQVLQGEGGHTAYAPQTEIEFQIAQILQATHGYVSNELVASGIGLPALHKAFCTLFDRSYTEIAPAGIINRAGKGEDLYLQLCHLRARCVMRTAGDLALANGALGGVVLAGGVTEHLFPFLNEETVKLSFTARGDASHYLDTCPVDALFDPLAPLIGAAALYT